MWYDGWNDMTGQGFALKLMELDIASADYFHKPIVSLL